MTTTTDLPTLNDRFMRAAEHAGDRPALVDREGDQWRSITWREYRDRASAIAMALRGLGVDHNDVVAIMCRNRAEHVIADVGTMLAGGTPFSVYNTLAPEQIAYVARDSGAKVAIVEDADFLATWQQIRADLPDLEHLVVIEAAAAGDGVLSWDDLLATGRERLAADPGEFDNAWRAVKPEDPVTIIYTSGTTGPPKGVVLTHANLSWMLSAADEIIEVPPGVRGLSYLPLAHVAERMTTHYRGIVQEGTIYFAREIAEVRDVLQHARPHAFMAVPRVWEKFHAAMMAALDAEPERRRKLVTKAIDVGTRVADLTRDGAPVPLGLKLQHALFDRVILSKLRERLGLQELKFALSGAAPIAPELLRFFAGLGIEILEVYGMTETTAVITANRPGRVRVGTVGEIVPGSEVRIADDGEILARGPHITPGYLNRPDATAEAIDADGWLHTGDLGELSADGYLRISGRKKELIITAGGKNLSPNNIEESIKQNSPLIGAICAVGDNQPFIGALVVLDAETAPLWAASHGIEQSDLATLSQHPLVVAEVTNAIKAGNEHLSRVEQVREFRILGVDWTPESGEVTPTLKLKRNVIHDKYRDVIDTIYAGVQR